VATSKRSYASDTPQPISGQGRRFALIASRFNAHVTDQLLHRAMSTLLDHGVAAEDIVVFRCPGAWELPQASLRAARTGGFDAVVALGCVIRGETPHFDFIAEETARGLGAAAYSTGVPVIFGVLTTDTEAQALERADPERGDKGREAALAALEMADLFLRLG
jgi:6,7-dimethyl-8-ribityllumazine synthase